MSEAAITYRDRVTPVELGDHVQTRVFFRRHTGRVVYIPGVSKQHPSMEFNGLRWVGIRLDRGGFVSAVIDPQAQYFRTRIILISRDSSPVQELVPGQDPHGEDSFAAPF